MDRTCTKLGVQQQGTGVLGALLAIVLVTIYQSSMRHIAANGGPPVLVILPWLPELFRFDHVNRDFFDIFSIVSLVFLFMISWEFLSHRLEKGLVLVLVFLGLPVLYLLAQGSAWFFDGNQLTTPMLSWEWTRMEIGFLIMGLSLLLPWILRLFRGWKQGARPVMAPWRWAFTTSLQRWLSGLCFFTVILLIIFTHPFYTKPFYENWRISCAYLFSFFLFLGFPYALITNIFRAHRGEDQRDPCWVLYQIFRATGRAIIRQNTAEVMALLRDPIHQNVLRDLLVKLFFVPLMISFLFGECGLYFRNSSFFLEGINAGIRWQESFNRFYEAAFHSIFVMDVSLSLIGYVTTSRWLRNKSKSVEPTVSGWMVALMCYPPFNGITGDYFPYDRMGGTPYALLQDPTLSMVLKAITLLLFAIYVWATMSFGLRFSNLTNRGLIARGPYAVIRHPAYFSKNLAWWTESLHLFYSPWQFVFLFCWNIVYTLRALTEERHLKQDPDYRSYCDQVRYRFIPGVW